MAHHYTHHQKLEQKTLTSYATKLLMGESNFNSSSKVNTPFLDSSYVRIVKYLTLKRQPETLSLQK